MGTPAYAVPTLDALCASGHSIAAVYTQPPRAAERGRKVRPTPVAVRAEAAGFPVRTPPSLKREEAQTAFAALGADLAVTVAYGLILPPAVLAAPRARLHQCPCFAAAALAGCRADPTCDHGGRRGDGRHHHANGRGASIPARSLTAAKVPIWPKTTGGMLHDTLAALFSPGWWWTQSTPLRRERSRKRRCRAAAPTYAAKLEKHEAAIVWRAPATHIERTVRALAPAPGRLVRPWRRAHQGSGPRRRRARLWRRRRERSSTRHSPLPAAKTRHCGPTRLQRAGKTPMGDGRLPPGSAPIEAGTQLPCPATS